MVRSIVLIIDELPTHCALPQITFSLTFSSWVDFLGMAASGRLERA